MVQKRISDLVAASVLTGNELVEISQLSADVTVSGITFSALAADNSFNDSAGGFVTAGFAVGDRVRVQGFTGNVANNLYVGNVTAVAPGKLTIGGTDGDVIVDEAAGPTVKISKWTTRRATVQEIADLGSGGGAGGIYRVGFFWTSAPAVSETLLLHTFSDDVIFADDFAGSLGDIITNPAATFTLDIQKNGSSVGSISISTGGVFTFVTTGGALTFAAGDQMKVSGPASAGTAANVSITFKGTID